MTGKDLSAAMRRGGRIYGTLVVSSSPQWPAAVQGTGVDFVFIDTEHIPMDRAALSWMCRTYAAAGIPPLVRIPSPNPLAACQTLDSGACGIIAPYVETAAQVQQLAGAVKLRPLKGERAAQALDDADSLGSAARHYLEVFNSGNMLIVNIESVPAIDNLGEILTVPGLDAVLIGPHDLSVSLGIPEQYQDPVFDKTVRGIIKRARAHGVAAGIHFWESVELELEWAKAGANLILHSGDITLFEKALRSDLAKMREALGDGITRFGSEVSTTV